MKFLCVLDTIILSKYWLKNPTNIIILLRASVRALVILMPLLGVTWIFGVLQLDKTSTLMFGYLFILCNGLQVRVRSQTYFEIKFNNLENKLYIFIDGVGLPYRYS